MLNRKCLSYDAVDFNDLMQWFGVGIFAYHVLKYKLIHYIVTAWVETFSAHAEARCRGAVVRVNSP